MDKRRAVVCLTLICCWCDATATTTAETDHMSCNNNQAMKCKNAGDTLTSLSESGQCEAKQYVAFTHTCTITAHYQPDMDYCCCAFHQRVMCCRYYQSGNLFRCVDTEDTVATLPELGVPAELLVPVIVVPITLLICCVVYCIRCCLQHKEDGDVFCRCTGDDEVSVEALKQTPVYLTGSSEAGCEEHSLLSTLPLGPISPCQHGTTCGHVHGRSQWGNGGSLRYSVPGGVGSCRTLSCHQELSRVSCHCPSHSTAASCSHHRASCTACCHTCRQWNTSVAGVSTDWPNCLCQCSGQAFGCHSSVSSGAGSDRSQGRGQGHMIPVSPPSSKSTKAPLVSPSTTCSTTLLILPSAPPDEADLGPPQYIASPPSYDESQAMGAAALATPTKLSLN